MLEVLGWFFILFGALFMSLMSIISVWFSMNVRGFQKGDLRFGVILIIITSFLWYIVIETTPFTLVSTIH